MEANFYSLSPELKHDLCQERKPRCHSVLEAGVGKNCTVSDSD